MPDSPPITLLSFSFKRDVPKDATMVFDARFLKNPFYEPALSALSGLDEKVGGYIETDPGFAPFYTHLCGLFEALLPRYREAGKAMTVAIGCTGGRHRSVHVVQKLGGFLQEKGYNVTVHHRDLGDS